MISGGRTTRQEIGDAGGSRHVLHPMTEVRDLVRPYPHVDPRAICSFRYECPRELPPSLAGALRPVLPELADATIAAIAGEVPAYARPLEGPFGRALRDRRAHARSRASSTRSRTRPPSPRTAARSTWSSGAPSSAAGAASTRCSAPTGSARGWRGSASSPRARAPDTSPATMYRLASAIFSYIDGISADSIEGYTQERTTAEGERQRRRRALARLLARDDVGAEEVIEVARQAGWPRPATRRRARRRSRGPGRRATRRRPARLATGRRDDRVDRRRVPPPCGCPTPSAPGRRAQLQTALDGAPAVLGPAVALARAPHSLARALVAHRLLVEGRLGDEPLVAADDHLAALVLHGGDRSLAADLAARVLAPLGELRPKSAARLRETLAAWLDHPGQVRDRGRAAARASADRPLPRRASCASCSARRSRTPTRASRCRWRCGPGTTRARPSRRTPGLADLRAAELAAQRGDLGDGRRRRRHGASRGSPRGGRPCRPDRHAAPSSARRRARSPGARDAGGCRWRSERSWGFSSVGGRYLWNYVHPSALRSSPESGLPVNPRAVSRTHGAGCRHPAPQYAGYRHG